MTLSRVSLILPLLLLTAAAPDVPANSAVPHLPPTVKLQTFLPREAMPVVGHRVVEMDGHAVARLIDVLVAPNGQPVAAVLDFGGFMGVGVRTIAVHWSALRFESGDGLHRIILTLSQDQFEAAPEYKDPEKPAPVVVPVVPVAPLMQAAPGATEPKSGQP